MQNTDDILVVDKGKIVDCGTHEYLVQKDGIYKDFIIAREKATIWKI